jgi:hypothetical protein
VRLAEGIAAFRVDRAPAVRAPAVAMPRVARSPRYVPAGSWTPTASPAPATLLERAAHELQRAETRLPHVGRGYFVMRWKSNVLPPPGAEREALIQQMVDGGLAEEFPVTDAAGRTITAIRSVRDAAATARAVREPGGESAPEDDEPNGNVA